MFGYKKLKDADEEERKREAKERLEREKEAEKERQRQEKERQKELEKSYKETIYREQEIMLSILNNVYFVVDHFNKST